ncbi:MAG: hypothetical protein CTY26_13255 [Methylophilus sp.]|nr:MAG: hypothetical protein CTY26_13255 [Methylophilus sp.]
MAMVCIRASFKRKNSKKPKGFNKLNPKDFRHKEWTVWQYVSWASKEHSRSLAFCAVGNMEF